MENLHKSVPSSGTHNDDDDIKINAKKLETLMCIYYKQS